MIGFERIDEVNRQENRVDQADITEEANTVEQLARLNQLANIGRVKELEVKRYADPDTGELFELETHRRIGGTSQRHIRQRSKHGYVLAFDTVAQAAQLPADHPYYLTYDERAILRECASLIEYEHQYVCNPRTGERMSVYEFARFVGKDRKFVAKILNSLQKKRYVRLERRGRSYFIEVDKEVAWRGEISKNDKVRIIRR